MSDQPPMDAAKPRHGAEDAAADREQPCEDRRAARLSGYGIERFGRLRAVLVNRPTEALSLVRAANAEHYLFDAVPDVGRYLAEHDRYTELLHRNGIVVHYLSDLVCATRDLLGRLPNLAYMHDVAVVTSRGAILSRMAFGGRRREEEVVAEALRNLGVPTLFAARGEDEEFEGCLALSPETLLVAHTERHSRPAIDRFIAVALGHFREVLYVDIPKARRFMHPDMIFNRASETVALAYLPAFLGVHRYTRDGVSIVPSFARLMADRGIEVVPVSDEEQERWGTSFVALEPGRIVHYDIALRERTKARLARLGVEIVEFHPEALLAGGGSLRCLTMRLWREGNAPAAAPGSADGAEPTRL